MIQLTIIPPLMSTVVKILISVCLFVTDALLNTNELWRTIALIYVDDGQQYTVSQQASDQGSYATSHATGFPNSQAGIIISPASTDGLTVLAQDRDSMPNWYTINHPTTLQYNEIQ